MPNNSYRRSVKRERELVNFYRSQGYDAARSAGSHSPWDVWAFNKKTESMVLIQVKTSKNKRKRKITNENFYPSVSLLSYREQQ